MDRVARRGPLARAPGALKGGTLWRRNKLSNKSLTMRKNWKGGPFGVFQHPFCRKTSKNWRGKFLFSAKKSHSAGKNWKGDPLGFSNIHSVAKQQKKLKGDPFGKKNFPEKKSCSAEKNWKGGALWSRRVWYVTRENRKNLFGSVR